jgi:DNA polymerase III gamma/tau subunit
MVLVCFAAQKAEQQRLQQALKVLAESEKQLHVSNDRSTWLTAALLQFAPDQSYLPSSVDTSMSPSPIAFDTLRKSQLQKLIPPRLEFLEIKFLTTRTPKFTCGAYTQTASYCCHQRKERDSHPNLPLSFRGQEKAAAFSPPIRSQSVTLQGHQQTSPKRVLWWQQHELAPL